MIVHPSSAESHLRFCAYTKKRLTPRVHVIEDKAPENQKEMYRVLTTKYLHWRYESEMRLFFGLNDKDPDNGLYFADFADRLVLKQVIVGHLSKVTRTDVQEALGDLANGVGVFKARLASRPVRSRSSARRRCGSSYAASSCTKTRSRQPKTSPCSTSR
ncbi:hypothetical protein KUL72_30855 [Bradyrhizobium arachidis]|uniref:hypothetical protein n=1 Tax=Bradyrhizobium arachidis TaxID=858423 RepID=UPI00216148C2|nr:hypothetical protein [Bradyrhizobium arachidis]UVO35735.1 hypothetical protein KUL72_30855 [Bradyrhizobium arachidis]